MADFLMPSLGADMTVGTLLEWRVEPGQAVKRGDIVAVVDTSKAEIEVEIFEDGVIDELLVTEGTRVPVGTVLATVRAGSGASPAAATASPPAPALAPAEAGTATPATPQPPTTASRAEPAAVPSPAPSMPTGGAREPQHRPRISPVARRAAERLGVDLSGLAGSGPNGAIVQADVERAATGAPPPTSARDADGVASAPPAPSMPAAAAGGEAGDRSAAMRLAIGGLMARSKREIPHYYLQAKIDMSRAMSWLAEENLARPVAERLLPSVLLLGAVAGAAAATPAMNGFWIDEAFSPAGSVHLGVAISLRGGGLIAPALRDADHMTLDQLMAGLRDLVARARNGRLRSSEMSDPTITVTNLGEQGVDLVHGVIYPPQVALVGFGGIREQPWAEAGMIGARPVVTATLAADHRASDGHAGSRFLTLIDHRLQEPEKL